MKQGEEETKTPEGIEADKEDAPGGLSFRASPFPESIIAFMNRLAIFESI